MRYPPKLLASSAPRTGTAPSRRRAGKSTVVPPLAALRRPGAASGMGRESAASPGTFPSSSSVNTPRSRAHPLSISLSSPLLPEGCALPRCAPTRQVPRWGRWNRRPDDPGRGRCWRRGGPQCLGSGRRLLGTKPRGGWSGQRSRTGHPKGKGAVLVDAAGRRARARRRKGKGAAPSAEKANEAGRLPRGKGSTPAPARRMMRASHPEGNGGAPSAVRAREPCPPPRVQSRRASRR